MSFEVKIPAVGESITSAEIGEWHKKEGEAVAVGDVLCTLESDKASLEVAADAAGVLTGLAPIETELAIGTVIAHIEEGEAAPAAKTKPKSKAASKKAKSKTASKSKAKAKESPEPAEAPAAPAKAKDKPKPAPRAAKPSPTPQHSAGRTSRKRMSPLRRKIANQLVGAQQTAAILTTFNECDMSAVMRLRKEVQEDFVARHGVKLGFMSFFVKATVEALKAVPSVNARIDGDEMVSNHFFDIGVAIGTEKGLIVPVLRDCEDKSFAEIEQDIIDYATDAKEGKVEIADLKGGVFTISNGGVYGSLLSTPILNPPQSGILGMHTIQQRPVAVDGEVVIRPMMYLALSYDHRLVDGKEAVTFLLRIKDCIENPSRLLVGA